MSLLLVGIPRVRADMEMNPITPADKAFFEQIKKAVLADDAESLSKIIVYPLVIRPNGQTIKLENEADVKKSSGLIFTAKLKSAVRGQSPDSLFKNWQGIMIGNGDIWYSQIGEATTNGQRWTYRVIAINLGKRSVSSSDNEEQRIQPEPPNESTGRESGRQEPVTSYVIAKGDTATAICRKFHISIEQLVTSNPGLKVERLQVGQRLKIPTEAVAPAENPK